GPTTLGQPQNLDRSQDPNVRRSDSEAAGWAGQPPACGICPSFEARPPRVRSLGSLGMANPLLDVGKFGQSIWYDNIRRSLITSGELAGMIERDGLLGVTSNPAIFEKAITGSPD